MIVYVENVRCVSKQVRTFANGDVVGELLLTDGVNQPLNVSCDAKLIDDIVPFEPFDACLNVYSNGFKRYAWLQPLEQ